jgi:GNAT superfamily N-acetyltransferase
MRGKTIHIRQASSVDTTLLAGIISNSFRNVAERFGLSDENCPKHPSNCTDEWVQKDLARGVIYYILEKDGNPVGCVAIEPASNDVCYLERLAVLPNERGNGYGRALVTNVLLKAKTLGAQEVGIGIIADHTELKEWYRKIGFIEGDTKDFKHLPFRVTFMKYEL